MPEPVSYTHLDVYKRQRVIHVALEIGFMIDTPEAPGMVVMGFDRSPEGGSSAFWIMDEDELLLVRDDQ